MNSFEIFFLDLGVSWMWSKLIVYLLLVIFFFSFSLFLGIRLRLNAIWRIVLIIFSTFIPILVYFAFHPVYSGDLFDESTTLTTNYHFPKQKTLSIFVLKGCPHCKNTIPFVLKLKDRNKDVSIRYVIMGENDAKFKGFTEEIPSSCAKVYESNALNAAKITNGNYPCFVLSSDGKAEKRWFNDDFGMRSMDVIESYFTQ